MTARRTVRASFAFTAMAALTLALACDMPTQDQMPPEIRGDLGAWLADDDDSIPQDRLGAQEWDDPLSHGEAGASGHIQVEDDVVVHVGQELLLTFSADLWDVDPDDTYFVISGAPDGSHVDPVAGTFLWVPQVEDIGLHVIGLDLWYESDNRVLDAARVFIEVIPADSLIEVGI
jgi:hypothetical protein